jgi:hypothetical protein
MTNKKPASKAVSKSTTKSTARSKLAKSTAKPSSSFAGTTSQEYNTIASTSVGSTAHPGTTERKSIDAIGNASTTLYSPTFAGTSERKACEATAVVPTPVELKFKKFPKLPAELRVKIWKLVPEPRIVEVLFPMDGRKNKHKFCAKIPAILHVCQESRHEGLKEYHPAFDSKWALNRVYFNFELDTLCYSSYSSWSQKSVFLRKIKFADLNRIQNVALKHWEIDTASRYPGLKELSCLDVSVNLHKTMDSCCLEGPSFHTIGELLESNSDNFALCSYLRGMKHDFSIHKEAFEKGSQGSRAMIVHRALCKRGSSATYL